MKKKPFFVAYPLALALTLVACDDSAKDDPQHALAAPNPHEQLAALHAIESKALAVKNSAAAVETIKASADKATPTFTSTAAAARP